MNGNNNNKKMFVPVVVASIELRGCRETLEKERSFIEEKLKQAGIAEQIINMVVTASDEACANVIEHYYNDDPKRKYVLTVNVKNQKIIILIESYGEEINIKSGKKIDLEKHFNQGYSRGLGIYMMHTLMDEVSYHYVQKMNVVKLVKYLD